MAIISIPADGRPWVVCKPENEEDLIAFLSVADADDVTLGPTQAATEAEAEQFNHALASHVAAGGDVDAFFGIALFDIVARPGTAGSERPRGLTRPH